jgi:hypothetical protein
MTTRPPTLTVPEPSAFFEPVQTWWPPERRYTAVVAAIAYTKFPAKEASRGALTSSFTQYAPRDSNPERAD